MATTAEQLTSVQAAISKIESGAQSYGEDGRTLTRADLKTLYERERELLTRQRLESGSGGRMMGGISFGSMR